jgi:hypothetical protein
VTDDLVRARQEVKRQTAAELEWLGATTVGRPSFAEAEALDRRGIPACHAWAVPEADVPPHLSAVQALRRWQDGSCALCTASGGRLLVDHCHQSGLIRGLLCTSCNTTECLQDAPAFVAYRERPPAVMLGVEEQYGYPWDGFGLPAGAKAASAIRHADAADALFAGVLDRFRTGGHS